MALKAGLKRSFLQSLYDVVEDGTGEAELISGDIPPTVVTLLDALKAFQRMGFSALKTGRLTIQSSGFQHMVTFAVPQQWRAFSQEDVFEMSQEFREVYNDVVLALDSEGNASPTDLQILQAMLADDRLQAVTSIQKDFSMIRWNQRY